MKLNLTITAETGRAYVPFLRKHVKAAHGVLCGSDAIGAGVVPSSRYAGERVRERGERRGSATKQRSRTRSSEQRFIDVSRRSTLSPALSPAYRGEGARSGASAFKGEGARLREMSLVLVGDRRMGDLHAQFMGIAGPTDVLTFEMETDAAGRVESGEVIVCVPEARRQAKIRKSRTQLELLLYSIHGMLHLLGYDDTTNRAYATMHSTEDAILTQIGFGPVFARPASRTGGRR